MMKHRVSLQRATEVRDTFGDAVQTWTELAQVWGSVDWEGGGETFQGERELPQIPVLLSVRRGRTSMSLREKDRALVPESATKLQQALATSTDTSMVVDTPGAMPSENDFAVRINSELLLVTAGAGTAASPYTVTRGAYGTTAAKHGAGKSVQHMTPVDIISVTPGRGTLDCRGVRGEDVYDSRD